MQRSTSASQVEIEPHPESAAAAGVTAEFLTAFCYRQQAGSWLKAKTVKLDRDQGVRGDQSTPHAKAAWCLTVSVILGEVDRAITPGAPAGQKASDMMLARFVGRATLRQIADHHGTSFACVKVLIEAASILFMREADARNVTKHPG